MGAGRAWTGHDLHPFPTEQVPRPVMLQSWRCLTFLHWPYEARLVQQLLPPGLEAETFGGAAWIGLTPFIAEVRRPLAPGFLSVRFPETNVRTYARAPDGSVGVWFFSLDAAGAFAVLGARTLYRLPYMWSRMKVEYGSGDVSYRSRRMWPGRAARHFIRIHVGGAFAPLELGDIDHFLTARWRLYTVLGGALAYAPVEHPPWPLFRARVEDLNQDLIQAAGLPEPDGEPMVHYSPGVEVKVGRPTLLNGRDTEPRP